MCVLLFHLIFIVLNNPLMRLYSFMRMPLFLPSNETKLNTSIFDYSYIDLLLYVGIFSMYYYNNDNNNDNTDIVYHEINPVSDLMNIFLHKKKYHH